jgi:hypothetical protein
LLSTLNGFSKTTVGSYQNVTIPFNDFAWVGSPTTIDGVMVTSTGANTLGFYIDYVTLNGGVNNGTGNFIEDVYASNDSLYKVKNGISTFWYKVTGGGGVIDSTLLDSAYRDTEDTVVKYRRKSGDIIEVEDRRTIMKFPFRIRTKAQTGAAYDSAMIYYGDSILIYGHITGSNLVMERMDGDSVVIALPSGGGGTTKYTTNEYGILIDSATANLYKVRADTSVIASKTYVDNKDDLNYQTSESLSDTSYKIIKGVNTKGTVFLYETGNTTYVTSGGDADSLGGLPATDYQLKIFSTNTQTSSYQLISGDIGKMIIMNVGSANILTVPTNSTATIAIGSTISVIQYGAGETTISPEFGVVIRSAGARYKLYEQYSNVVLQKIATNEWLLTGDTEL